MEPTDSVVLPYPRDTVARMLPADINFVCRQLNYYQWRYWRVK